MASILKDYKYEGAQVPFKEIRILHFAVGTQIPAIRNATFKIYTPGLIENQERIECIEPTTESYGHHSRQLLDIYQAENEDPAVPILVFFYGGGLVRGDRKMAGVANGLVYHNVGTYFASRGITTVIPDYRRVSSPEGGEDAVFPSGGEDVSQVLKWLETSSLLRNKKRDVIVLGNSAGALHVATFLLEPRFHDQKKSYVDGSKGYVQGAKEYISGERGISLKEVILLGMPAHFQQAAKDRKDMLRAYYGSEDHADEQCPVGLLRELAKSKPTFQSACLPKIYALVGEFDPHDEIINPTTDFVNLWKETFNNEGIEYVTLDGHNHISPVVALMSGDESGERWGEDVVKWILGHPPHGILEKAHEIRRGPKKMKKVDQDVSTQEAKKEDEKNGGLKGGKKNPGEDYSTEIPRKEESGKKVDPKEDYSTEIPRRTEGEGKENPSEDYSTEAVGKETRTGKTDPSEDASTRAAAREDEKSGRVGKEDPTAGDSGKELL